MDVQITPGEKWKRHIEATLPSSEVDPQFQQALKRYQKSAHLAGFRKGKTPLQVIDKIYGDAIRQEMIDKMLPGTLEQIRSQHQLNTVGPAKIDEIKYDRAEGLRFRATVEVEPEVELKRYTGLQFENVIFEVTDDDVVRALEQIRERHGWLENVDSGAQPGHLITADVQVVDPSTGAPIIGQRLEDRQFLIAPAGDTEDKLSPLLVGMKPGDIRSVMLPRPKDDGSTEQVHYRINAKEVSVKKLPELDDELARDAGSFNSLQELRDTVRQNLLFDAENRSRSALRDEIIEELLKQNPFELPDSMVEAYTHAYLESLAEEYKDVNVQVMREDAQSSVIRYLRWRYLRNRIAETEGVFVEDEEMRQTLRAEAARTGEDPQRTINQVMNNEKKRERLYDQLLDSKVLSLLEGRMKIETRKVPYKDRDKSRIIHV